MLTEDKEIRLVIAIETLDDFLQMDNSSDNPSARRALSGLVKWSPSTRNVSLSWLFTSFKVTAYVVIADKDSRSDSHCRQDGCKIYLRQIGEGDGRRIVSAQTCKGVPIEPTYLMLDEATQTSTLGRTLADDGDSGRDHSP